jgi:diguanylate cyclase (GGDEF)-like protein
MQVGEPAAIASSPRLHCDKGLKAGADGWAWSRLDDPRRLDSMPDGWHLLLPHRQLDSVMVVITHRDGTVTQLARLNGALAVDWSPEGHAYFVSPRPGRDVVALAIGYEAKNVRSALRYATALPAAAYERRAANFHLVVGLFLGTVASALIYNLFIGVGRRHTFQRVYLVWGGLALLNGLIASGLLQPIWPALAGPAGILANKLVVTALFASGTLFLLTLVEPGILPRMLVRIGVISCAAMGVVGLVTALEAWLPLGLAGYVASAVPAMNILMVAAVAVVAARRGSRAIWFYLAGWTPILVFGLLLVAHELAMLPHSQMIDLGGMLAIAFESVVLSLAIADRFRHLQRDRDELERKRQMAEADRAALQRVADTDQLTGLSNRRAFETTLAAIKKGEIDRLALILIDIDHFKLVNDRLGHDAGDDLLVRTAQQLRANVRADDIVARLGGDEFAILLKGADARHVDHVIRGLLAAQRHAEPTLGGDVTFSIGAALFPDDDPDPAQLYKNADLALYEAKRLGRARSHRYAPVLRRRDEHSLFRAAHDDELASLSAASLPGRGDTRISN